jgi:hypothetical protein
MSRVSAGLYVSAILAIGGWAGYRLWPRTIEVRAVAVTPVWQRLSERDTVTLPGRFLVAEVSQYDDEFFAYLMFQYLRGVKVLKDTEVLLTFRKAAGGLVYPLQVHLDNDLVASLTILAEAKASRLIKAYAWRYVNEDTLLTFRHQTKVFVTAYKLGPERRLEQMTHAELSGYLQRFVRFKSTIDPRIRRRIEPVPEPLSNTEAHRMATDIVAVAEFYSIPLDFFLGIGAMENNYMNIKGDLQHAVWKNRADKGDVIVKRRAGRVLVQNPALGPWQVTRETLRYAHNLYLTDYRDYSILPEHLRPPKDLNVDEPDPEVLTTFAGLLFRELLDRFHGDVANAVGAYNGGPGNPNAIYEAGVRTVAEHARRVVEQAAALHGQKAAGMRFFSAK